MIFDISDPDIFQQGLGLVVCQGGKLMGLCIKIDTESKTYVREIMPSYEGSFFGDVYTHSDPSRAAEGWRVEIGTYDEVFYSKDCVAWNDGCVAIYSSLDILPYDGRYSDKAVPPPPLPGNTFRGQKLETWRMYAGEPSVFKHRPIPPVREDAQGQAFTYKVHVREDGTAVLTHPGGQEEFFDFASVTQGMGLLGDVDQSPGPRRGTYTGFRPSGEKTFDLHLSCRRKDNSGEVVSSPLEERRTLRPETRLWTRRTQNNVSRYALERWTELNEEQLAFQREGPTDHALLDYMLDEMDWHCTRMNDEDLAKANEIAANIARKGG